MLNFAQCGRACGSQNWVQHACILHDTLPLPAQDAINAQACGTAGAAVARMVLQGRSWTETLRDRACMQAGDFFDAEVAPAKLLAHERALEAEQSSEEEDGGPHIVVGVNVPWDDDLD